MSYGYAISTCRTLRTGFTSVSLGALNTLFSLWTTLTSISFFTLQSSKLLGSEIRISERIALITFITLRPLKRTVIHPAINGVVNINIIRIRASNTISIANLRRDYSSGQSLNRSKIPKYLETRSGITLRALLSGITFVSLVSFRTLRTSLAGITFVSLITFFTLRSLRTCIALWTSLAGGSSVALFSFFACGTLFAARRSSSVSRSEIPISIITDEWSDAISTVYTVFTWCASRANGALRACVALRACCACVALFALFALLALRTCWAGFTLITFRAINASRRLPCIGVAQIPVSILTDGRSNAVFPTSATLRRVCF